MQESTKGRPVKEIVVPDVDDKEKQGVEKARGGTSAEKTGEHAIRHITIMPGSVRKED